MAVIKWLPEAMDDLKRLHSFIEPHSANAAARAVVTLVEAANSLLKFPEMGAPWKVDMAYRELQVRFGSRGYAVRYRLYEDQIIIVRVWHALEDR